MNLDNPSGFLRKSGDNRQTSRRKKRVWKNEKEGEQQLQNSGHGTSKIVWSFNDSLNETSGPFLIKFRFDKAEKKLSEFEILMIMFRFSKLAILLSW